MTNGTAKLSFRIVRNGTRIQVVRNGGNGRVSSGQTITWTSDENFSLLLRNVAYELDSVRIEDPDFNPAPPASGGWTAMAKSHSHTVGTGPYFIKYWVMLEDPAVEVLDPGIIIDR